MTTHTPHTLWITYCSAKKDPNPEPIAAIERYDSNRIRQAYAKALAAEEPFLILSGKYGLIEPDTEIPWYDHYLSFQETFELSIKSCTLFLETCKSFASITVKFVYSSPVPLEYLQVVINLIRMARSKLDYHITLTLEPSQA